MRRRLREAGAGGMSFAQVRAELSMEAHNEPNLQPVARGVNGSAAAASGGQRSKRFNSSGGPNSKQVRNALILQAAPLDKVPCGEVTLSACIPQRGRWTVRRDCFEQNDTAFVAVDAEFVVRRGIQ